MKTMEIDALMGKCCGAASDKYSMYIVACELCCSFFTIALLFIGWICYWFGMENIHNNIMYDMPVVCVVPDYYSYENMFPFTRN